MKKLIAIDGNSLLFRAYYAIHTVMTSRDGVPTNAIHGFTMMLLKLLEQKPDYMLVAFDMHGGTFRHDTYPEYKAGRAATPEDLIPQFPALKSLLRSMGIAVCECPRYEADDILGTISKIAEKEGVSALIVTGDRDALQLISDTTNVMLTKKGITETVLYDKERLMEDYGLTPAHMIDLKALMGDSSDNIPGIKGIGEKTAKSLLEKYGSLENVLENASNEKGALQKKLIDGADSARMSYGIGTICREAPIDMELADCKFDMLSIENAIPVMAGLGLKSSGARFKALVDSERGDGQVAAALVSVDSSKEIGTHVFVSETREITTEEGLSEAAEELTREKLIAMYVDEELSMLTESGVMYVIKTGGNLLEPGLDPESIYRGLAGVFQDDDVKKIVFDGKRLMNELDGFGIKLNGLAFDISIADYMVNALNPAKSLDELAASVGISEMGAEAVMRLYYILNEQMRQKSVDTLYYGVELPLVRVLFDMERTGFAVDSDALRSLGEGMVARISELSEEIFGLAGHTFNILSPKQLGTVLFDELGLPPQKKTKTGYSTDSDVLESLEGLNPIVEKIIEFRFLTKLKSTFIDAMLNKINPDGRIHTTLNQNVAATGRISSAEPNLQNIPVRTEQGRQIRKAFIASEGNVLVGADYSQIELRVLAHMSNDNALKDAFVSGDDTHSRTAAEVFGVGLDEVTKDMRSAAKAVNFGIVYGISEFGLAKQLGITRKDAKGFIERYLDRCTGVREYMKKSVEDGRKNGYAVTLTGRKRDLPELKSGNYNTRSFGERVAMNMPVQGTAADIIKLAMLRVHDSLERNKLRAKLVLQIHDELLIDCPLDEVDTVKKLLHDCMMGNNIEGELPQTTKIGEMLKLNVPLVADVEEGHSWFDTK